MTRYGRPGVLIRKTAYLMVMDADLLRYVKRALRKGYDERRIVHQLTQQGWKEREVHHAIHEAKANDSSGGIIIAALLIGLLAGAGFLTWFLVADADRPTPNTGNESLNDTNPPDTNTSSNESENASQEYRVSECELRESQQEKFECYQSKLRNNISSVECIQLPQPDRRLCTHAYQSVTA